MDHLISLAKQLANRTKTQEILGNLFYFPLFIVLPIKALEIIMSHYRGLYYTVLAVSYETHTGS
jgi:hypothetical protein